MNTLDFARDQFAITTLFHFIFVPMSIGLSSWVALCQTRYYRSGNEVYLRMTKFWGKFLLISMAIGVVTGIVQEFQFGMNWSLYSRYVGDIFGAPLAMEGLIAFFLESTFLGLWIFGWGRLSPKLHLTTIWLTAAGTALSAYFILAANSWMQHPVGYTINHVTHKAVLTNIFAVMFNPTVLLAYPHTVLGAFTTAGMLVIAISAFLMLTKKGSKMVSKSLHMALPITLVMALLTMGFGDGQGRLMVKQEPMKMAAAEAVYHTASGAPFSLLAIGAVKHNPGHVNPNIKVPHALSLIETLSWNGRVEGMNNIQAQERAKYGPGNYIPIVGVEYWSFRLMVGAGMLMALICLVGIWLMLTRKLERKLWFHKLALLGVALPICANWMGWIFTEVGRQPWVVFGLLKTSQANSPNVSTLDIVLTLAGYLVIYGILIVIGAVLMYREAKHGPEPDPVDEDGAFLPPAKVEHPELVMAY
jgi:cytochrome d ubiquinol oxidase subunit I